MFNSHSCHPAPRSRAHRQRRTRSPASHLPATSAVSDRQLRKDRFQEMMAGACVCCDVGPRALRNFGASILLLFIFLAVPKPLQAVTQDPDPVPELAGEYLNPALHYQGRYELALEGTRVTATLSSTRSPVSYWASQTAQPLFYLPEGFRPPFPIIRLAEGVPVQEDGSPCSNPPRARSFLIQIEPDGAVLYADEGWVNDVAYTAYSLQTIWGTTPAANDRAVLEILDAAWFGETILSAVPPPVQIEVPEKTFRGWTTPAHRTGPFVTIDVDGRVTEVGAPEGHFHGPLRPELGELHNLERLEMKSSWPYLWGPSRRSGIQEVLDRGGGIPSDNFGLLYGEIPPQLGQLSRLRHLNLEGHLLTGAIPSELGQLGSLESLDLSNNRLGDSIPAELGQLELLKQLYLSGNRLTGPVPPELGQLSRLERVALSHNRLAGCLPSTWQIQNFEVSSQANLDPEGSAPLPFCSDAGPLTRKFEGDFANLAANWGGRTRLEIHGNAVYASMQAARSPVQYLTRQQPEVLFTVPMGFRPASTLTWEVAGQPVQADGLPEHSRRDIRVFRMSVDPDGHVRYVDDAGVDGVGYLRYRTVLAWPLAGVQPGVCERSQAVQSAILASLEVPGAPEEACAEITWNDLAGIQSLEIDAFSMGRRRPQPDGRFLHTPLLRYDLAGLSNLEKLHVHSAGDDYSNLPVQLPSRFLDHVPLLRDLVFSDVHLQWRPADFLTHTPSLRSLVLEFGTDNDHVPEGFLSMTPQLQFLVLHLQSRSKMGLPSGFLARAPQLQILRIYLDGEDLTPWPPLFLAHASHLEILTLAVEGDGTVALPSNFLSHAPRLRQARIWATAPGDRFWGGSDRRPALQLEVQSSFLAHAPLLEQLWLQKVDTGPHYEFLHALSETTQIHWVPWDDTLFPAAASLTLEPARHWLHFIGLRDEFVPERDYSEIPLNIVTGGIESARRDWLARQTLHALTVVAPWNYSDPAISSMQLSNLQHLLDSQNQGQLSRLTVLLNQELSLPTDWGRGRAYDWMYLGDYLARRSDSEVLSRLNATVLLLQPVTPLAGHGWPRFGWPSADRQTLRDLMQSPKARHLGLILNVGSYRPGETWILPANLLDDLDFECVELDLSLQKGDVAPIVARMELTSLDVDLHWLIGGNASDWRSLTGSRLLANHWGLKDYRTFGPHRELWSSDPAWFEEEHLAWARDQECANSLYLHFRGGNISLEAGVLARPGAMRHLRIVHPLPPCRDCPDQ